MRLYFFVKLQYQSTTAIFSVGNKYSVCETYRDVINSAWPAK